MDIEMKLNSIDHNVRELMRVLSNFDIPDNDVSDQVDAINKELGSLKTEIEELRSEVRTLSSNISEALTRLEEGDQG